MKIKVWMVIGIGAVILMIILGFYIYILMKDEESPITNRPPNAYITPVSQEVNMGESAFFSAEGTEDPDGDELTYFWEFGDGATGEGFEVNHTYDEGNIIFQVNLTVSDGELNSTGFATINVMVPPELAPASVGLGSQAVNIPLLGKFYKVTVQSTGTGDTGIRNISYELISPGTNETLAGGPNSTVYDAFVASVGADVKYYDTTGDEEMTELVDYFQISVDETGAKEGDIFRLFHIPSGEMMGECRLLG